MAYKAIIDDIKREEWECYAGNFADYNIYQTWAYQQVRADMDRQKVSRIVIKDENNAIVTMASVRIKHIKPLGLRIGHIQWGPLFFKKDGTCDCSVEVLKILRKAYLGTRVNVLRIVPNITNDTANQRFIEMFEAGGFRQLQNVAPYHTMVLPLNRPVETLRKGLHQKWRKKLRKAESAGVEVVERMDEELFKVLEDFYQELRRKKGFKGVDLKVFARAQSSLSNSEKMSLIVAYFDGEPVTVHVTSNLGDTAIALLVASSEKGYTCWSSYLAWWKALTASDGKGMKKYDLGGIDFEGNPAVSRFKAGIGGEKQFHIGTFEAYTNSVVRNIFRMAEKVYRMVKKPND